MTEAPKTREDLVECICRLQDDMYYANQWGRTNDIYKRVARTKVSDLLNALDSAGLAIVPKEPTQEMISVAFATTSPFDLSGNVQPGPAYRAMLTASPYRGKE